MKDVKTFIFDVDGVLTDGSIHITTAGEMLRIMNVKDGYAIKTALEYGYNICIISGGSNQGVASRLKGLGVKHIHLGVHNKSDILIKYLNALNLNASDSIYMGDDIPDLRAMEIVGLPCCPQDAAPEIKAVSRYISHKNGGHGAVRDIIEQVLKINDQWNNNFKAKYD